MTRAAPDRPLATRLCLLAEIRPGKEHAAHVAAALETLEAVTLVLAAPCGGAIEPRASGALVAMAQGMNVATLLVDDVAAARAAKADGVHLSWSPDVRETYTAARAALGPGAIVGAEAGRSRHDAMQLGEAGADYIAFGLEGASGDQQDANEARLDMIDWWADLFEVPVVAFDVATAREAEALAAAGADFVAVTLPSETGKRAVEAWAAGMRAAIRQHEEQRA
jgi:thiamine-phosphate pyrophosphorylase